MKSINSDMLRKLGFIAAASALAFPAVAQDADADGNTTEEQQAGPASAEEASLPEPNIEVVEDKPVKAAKITDKSHPDYVRCKKEAVIGSRARRKKTCMTNREWARTSRRGNEASRDFVGDNQAGFQPGT